MIRCEALLSILLVFPNKFNKFNNMEHEWHYDIKIAFISKILH